MLVGTKFEPNHHNNNYGNDDYVPLPSTLSQLEKVDCRAYYPTDSASFERNSKVENNPHGTSCSPRQLINAPPLLYGHEFYDRNNSCSCNIVYREVIGSHRDNYGKILIENRLNRIWKVLRYACWYPGTIRGIKEMITAHQSFYLSKEKILSNGWTECSASPNILNENMIDVLVIRLPLSMKREDHDNSYLEDLNDENLLILQNELMHYAHLQFPILLLKETRGIEEK